MSHKHTGGWIEAATDDKLDVMAFLAIDSTSVLWSVQQEADYLAETRAIKKGFKAENSNATQIDWVMAKRPIKQISNRMNASPPKFLILTARAKDLYEGRGDNPQKVGITPDIMKGMDYDVNLSLQLSYCKDNNWLSEFTRLLGT